MELIVLGSAAAYAGPGEACSSYLLRTSSANVLIDIGNGSLSNLFEHLDPAELDAIVITHAHMDHFGDIFGLRQYLRYHGGGQGRIPVYASDEFERKIVLLSDSSKDHFDQVFSLVKIRDLAVAGAARIRVGETELELFPLSHGGLESYGVFCTDGSQSDISQGDRSFADAPLSESTSESLPQDTPAKSGRKGLILTGDMGPSTAVLESYRGKIHTLIAEATLRDSDRPHDSHLSGGDAGELAAFLGVERLALSHFWPAFDRWDRVTEARAKYNGEIVQASEGMRLRVSSKAP